jgi:hypothetical protein
MAQDMSCTCPNMIVFLEDSDSLIEKRPRDMLQFFVRHMPPANNETAIMLIPKKEKMSQSYSRISC